MARRNRIPKPDPADRTAFTLEETAAIISALVVLYKRELYYIVAPTFKLPALPDVYREMIPAATWEAIEHVENLVVPLTTNYYHAVVSAHVAIENTGGRLDVQSKRLLPDPGGGKELVIPEVLVGYVSAAVACRRTWLDVYNVFQTLNKTAAGKRLTAAYNWPCAATLLRLGGLPGAASMLSDITRTQALPASLLPDLRETNAFVMQRTLLPAIDRKAGSEYEGDSETGLACKISYVPEYGDAVAAFGNNLWPLGE